MIKRRLVIFGCTILVLLGFVAGFSNNAVKNMNLGLDLQGGFEILYEVKPLDTAENKDVDMAAVVSAVRKRVDVLGVSEPDISVEGDRIRVQLAGVEDSDSARDVISSSAVLTFRDTSDNLLMDATVLKEGGASLGYNNGSPVVYLAIADQAKFAEVTGQLATSSDRLLVTWLDYETGQSYLNEVGEEHPAYISSATVNEALNSDSVFIEGGFSEEEAQQLVDLLNSGSLNFQMTEIYSNVVSADLGSGAFDVTIFAGLIGIIGIIIFMVAIYRVPGIISAVTIAAYTLVTLMLYNLLGGVFTLSGIAGLVLGVGMAVDSSVITFERIKDGLFQGRSVQLAYKEGVKKSFVTIFDSQITTLISAVILYTFGTGSVKGFATMLLVSTVVTVLFNVTIVRFLLGQIVKSGYLDDKKSWFAVKESNIPNLNKGEEQKYFGPLAKFDFIKNAKYFIAGSIAIFIAAVVMMGVNLSTNGTALNLGIDFSSGTRVTVTSNETIDSDSLEKGIEALGVDVDSVKLSGSDNSVATISIKKAINEEERQSIYDYVLAEYETEASDATVSPVVGQELVKNAFLMSILSWLAILVYISVRFKWDYAIAAIVALVHDVLIILAVFAILGFEITTDIIAVLLAIIGYSINDTIVGFDRIRENENNKKAMKKELTNTDYNQIVNESLRETIVRSIITTMTTLIPVCCLLFLGSPSIFTFNFALLIGLIAGANSSINIAAQLWYHIRCNHKPKHKVKKKHKKVDEVEEYIVPGIND